MSTLKGIDVSKHQGVIDWLKAKQHVDFALIRCGFGSDLPDQDDKQFENNVKGCESNDIPWGAYLYSYATSLEEVESEVQHVLRLLKGKVPLYPIYIDMEDADGYKAKRNVSNAMCADICAYFCDKMTKAGCLGGIYANKDWFENRINDHRLKQYPTWLAQWASKPTYSGKFGIWQYTSSGNVDGIGNRVDMNLCYEDYPSIIKANKLNGYRKPKPVKVPAPAEFVPEIKAGDTVQFKGGSVFTSSTVKIAAATKGKATCRVTLMNPGSPHPYHCEGGGVYGWVNAESIGADVSTAKSTTPTSAIKAGDIITYGGRLYGDSYGGNPGKTISGTFKVDRVIDGRKYGIHIPAGWIEANDIKKT